MTSSESNSPADAAGHLLILACSDRKCHPSIAIPALELYDGGNFRVLRKYLRENGWPPGLIVRIISAEYEIIDAMKLIEPYDRRLDKESAREMNLKVLKHLESLKKHGNLESVFINLGQDYRPAISGIEKLFGDNRIRYAEGGIGQKQQSMKQWLYGLPNRTAVVNSQAESKGYPLYFFPDWADYVYEPFQEEETTEDRNPKNRRYAHEIFENDVPYDGLLLSLAQLKSKKGPLNYLAQNGSSNFREEMRVPERLLLFGDCGAFSYIKDSKPSLTCEEAASLYNKFGFDLGTSVDHIPISSLSEVEKKVRMELTTSNAENFLEIHRNHQEYSFVPIGSIQGITAKDYADSASQYVEFGYKHIALGGLVRRQDSEILEIVAAVREALQSETRGKDENIWVHLFGILRPNLQPIFEHLGVSSFDSASYLRKAWSSRTKNYLAADGKWYGSIRVPFSNSKSMQEVAKSNPEYSKRDLRELEQKCLSGLKSFDVGETSEQEILEDINKYSALLQRKETYNHFPEKHQELLKDRPWEKCKCKVCQDAGINIVVFRGANRNRRRGFHNTWVFYHKILRKTRKKVSKKSDV